MKPTMTATTFPLSLLLAASLARDCRSFTPSQMTAAATVATTPPLRDGGISGSRKRSLAPLRYASLEHVSEFYRDFPLESAVLTCGVKASVADTVAQIKGRTTSEDGDSVATGRSEDTTKRNSVLKLEGEQTVRGSESRREETRRSTTASCPSSSMSVIDSFFDWFETKRNLAYVLYGGIFVGLASHIEYNHVFPLLFGSEHDARTIVEKVLFDDFVAAPIFWLPPAYLIKEWVYGGSEVEGETGPAGEARPGEEPSPAPLRSSSSSSSSYSSIAAAGLRKYVADVRENDLLLKYWSIWVPAQSVSFSVVPDHLRVAFMASVSFFWFILLSTVQSDKQEQQQQQQQ